MKSSASSSVRTWALVGVLAILITCWLFFRRQINHALALQLFLGSKSPREEVFQELATQGDDSAKFLQSCWATGKVPHREFVASYLKEQAVANSPLLLRIEPLALACATDGDTSVRELGLAILETAHNPRTFEAACAQLNDLDPQVRHLGLDYLRKSDPKRAVPILIRLLDDPDLRIAATAEVGLRNWSGEDYGVRVSMAIPSPENRESAQIESNSVAAIRQGIGKRKEWWRTHQKDYPISPNSAVQFSASTQTARPRAAGFTLADPGGKKVSLSDFRGNVVLVNFWATWCTACLAEIPELIALQDKLGDKVAIIGVTLDGVPDEHGHILGAEPGETSHNDSVRLASIRAKVERAVKLLGINYRVLLDPENSVGGQYNGGELPTTVIFDKDGRMRRRFLGERSLGVFEAMIAEAGRPINDPSAASGNVDTHSTAETRSH